MEGVRVGNDGVLMVLRRSFLYYIDENFRKATTFIVIIGSFTYKITIIYEDDVEVDVSGNIIFSGIFVEDIAVDVPGNIPTFSAYRYCDIRMHLFAKKLKKLLIIENKALILTPIENLLE